MQAEELLNIINNPHKITTQEATVLQQVLKRYPYFQLAYTLLAKAAYDQNPTHEQQAIQLAAVYATDRRQLKLLLENKLSFAATQQEVSKEFESIVYPAQPVQELSESNAMPSYVSNLSNTKVQKPTNPKTLEQFEIIKNFIHQDRLKPGVMLEMDLESSQVDLTESSATLHNELITESLAKIMHKQGKLQCALAIYQQLQLKFPQKKSYFAALAEALKKEI